MSLLSCSEEQKHPYSDLSAEYFRGIADSSMMTNSAVIRECIMTLTRQDKDSMLADTRTKSHYRSEGSSSHCFLWINRHGVSTQADSLIACLDSCENDGLKPGMFRLEQIKKDLELVRNLDFDHDREGRNSVNRVLARLEYNLTKAFLKYAVGQRYGFTDPRKLFNAIDVREQDSLRTSYYTLYDVNTHTPGKYTYLNAIEKIRRDSVGWYLREAQPKSPYYRMLKAELNSGRYDRSAILINMERARWRAPLAMDREQEFVAVNIPAYHLWAVRDGVSVLDMRVGCGSQATKTPLLYSHLKRMDFNPPWVIPWSIRKKDLVHHAGNGDYFLARNYFARNRKTGTKLTGSSITYDVIMSPDWSIMQEGGKGNALGRIIFRFDNNFSVYLHDTSSRKFFANDDRSVSHGCIRVEKPFDLACYMLRDADEELTERIRYTMEIDLLSPDCKKGKLIHSQNIEPQIPLFIVYYTLFNVPGTEAIQRFPDVYGYDAIMRQKVPEMFT